jgi:hypothetical protein
MPRNQYHIVIAIPLRGEGPVVVAACDVPRSGRRRQVSRVDLETAPLVRALPSGDLVDLRTGARVATAHVCAGCRRNETAAAEFAGQPEKGDA